MARRQALSQGKSALPSAVERVRSGFRAAALPLAVALSRPVPAAVAAPTPMPMPPATAVAPPASALPAQAGRQSSMLRRRQLSAGKQSLSPPATAEASAAAPASTATSTDSTSCREQARLRRTEQSRHGRGATAPAAPSRPPRQGSIDYAPKVVTALTQGRQRVTGLRIGGDDKVTGNKPGAALPISGTQYIDAGAAPVRAAGPKVGLARTAGGLTVSGTLVRSQVRITGDEPGSTVTITGEADQRLDDDLTPRSEEGLAAQFGRRADPHGSSVFGSFLGRAPLAGGSRRRERSAAVETTDGGLAITGSAIGRSARVTGDEDGACRTVTGDQYLSPARRSSECGGSGGGTAPAQHLGAARRDPVTGAKVSEARTWGAQRVTGADVEHRRAVTGDEPGSCAVITGTPYQGPSTMAQWCDPAQTGAAEQRLPRQPARAPISGDVPVHAEQVTGTARGATRDITGTPYYRKAMAAAVAGEEAIARIDSSFSVASPQRRAQLRADRSAAQAPSAAGRMTGAFALGQDKITGNLEFLFRPRLTPEPDAARARITGEGRTEGPAINGDAWAEQGNVTGTEGYIAAERNPSERSGKPQAWAGAGQFKSKGKHEAPRQIVTGMVGWTAKSAAKVTLSGGAQG